MASETIKLKTVMKKRFGIVACCLALMSLTAMACQGGTAQRKGTEEKMNGETKTDNEMKTLIVYFSYTAGNTKGIAEKIQKTVGGDIVRLETVTPYPDDYDTVVKQGQQEVEQGYKPELKPLGVDVKDYDRIIVGTPTWWYRMVPAVWTFLSDNEFGGKVVVPFSTHAGWPGSVIKDMTAVAEKNGAKVTNAHSFKFSSNKEHFDRMETSEKELDEWVNSLK